MSTKDGTGQPVVLVTGAAQRIGAATVRQFHAQGFNVIIHCRHSTDAANALAHELEQQRPASTCVIVADLLELPDIERLAAEALASFGRLDVLVNNASTFYATPLGSVAQRDWRDLMGSNARAPLFLCQALAGELRQRRGSIVNLTDMNAERGMAGFSTYTMAKGALQAMTHSLARELAPKVRVNAVSPGAILWPDHASDPVAHAEQQARILAGIPLGHLGQPEDIARAVFFLGWQASYVTGQVLCVDGGRQLAG